MSNAYIERMNYENDRRVVAKKPVVEFEIYNADTDEYETVSVPTVWQICDICNGNGTHVNPSIDAGGISSEDFLEDPDFYDDYMSGCYDVPCNCCNGSGKVKAPNLDVLTEAQREGLEAQEREEAEYEAMCRAERIMGA